MLRRLAVLALVVAFAGAANADDSAEGEAGLSSVLGFFSLGTGVPRDLARAIDHWQAGHLDRALAALARVAPEADRHRDDVFLLRGLVLDDLDWRDEAAAAYAGVLAATPPSPYYPLALLRLVEGRRAVGDRDAAIEAYRRYFAMPWEAKGARARAVRHLLEAYGDLRPSGPELTASERETLASPARLADLAREAKERPAERVAYLAGLELVAAGERREAIEAFERVGLSSPYYRYALFSSAQALYASGDLGGARRKLRRLAILPARRGAETALAERARLLEAQILFDAGDGDGALRAAADAGDGPFALAAQLLRGEICLENGSPSLAVAYLRDLEATRRDEDLDTRYALGLGAAYRSLGDLRAASSVLRVASERLGASRSTLEGGGADDELETLRREVESAVAAGLDREAARRARIAEGARRVVAFKGPMNVGKIVRVLFTSHANTILGEPVYDTKQLGEWDLTPAYRPKRPDALWRAYLASPERAAVEAAVRRLRALDDAKGAWLAHDTVADLGEERSAWRHERIGAGHSAAGESAPEEEQARAREILEEAINGGLRRVVRAEAESIRRLQYEVDLALSQTIVSEGADLQPTR